MSFLFLTDFLLLRHLPNSIEFAAVGTYNKHRKNTAKLNQKFTKKGESEMAVSKEGLHCIHWKDTKDVLIMSNCHTPEVTEVQRRNKDGTTQNISCPVPIVFYNKYMGGVDHADQMFGLYDLERKSKKWWRKVFFRLLLTAVFNVYIIIMEKNHKKMPYIQYFVTLAESIIDYERSKVGKRKKN